MTTVYDNAMKQTEPEQNRLVPGVTVENVFKSFGSFTVLNGISLRVNRGETLAVLGRSGT